MYTSDKIKGFPYLFIAVVTCSNAEWVLLGEGSEEGKGMLGAVRVCAFWAGSKNFSIYSFSWGVFLHRAKVK